MSEMKNIWKSKWKMFVISVVSASVICVNLPVFAEQEVTNIAFGITPTQSFSSSTTGTLSTVTDGIKGEGSGGTSWFIRADYHYSQNPALIFDLGASATVSSFVVIGSTRYTNPGSDNSYALAKNYDILYSDNGNDWTTAATVSDNVNYENTTEIPEITARYWKIFVKFQSKTSGERAKICEIEIYGTKTELPPPTEPPTVGMTGERVEIDEGETVRVSAIAFSEISTIKTVAFYEGTTKLADGVLENGEWVATLAGLTPGEHMISAKAVDEEGGEAFSDSMRVRVHGDEYSNIALGKIVNADHGNTSDSYPQALVDGITDQGSGVYKWIANAANANGAYAEIDLASGFDNEFIIDKITVMSAYADVSTTDILKDFTLSYYAQDKWITAAQVTGAGSVYSYSFENPVVTTKVKLTSNMSDAFRVREVEVEGKLYRKPVLVVVSPESNPANVFENKFQMKLSATNLDSAFSRAEVSLNGVFKEASVSIDNSIYTITVDGLSDGENVIFARLYDRYDRYSDSEAVTVLYISGEQFERDFKNCITIQDIGNLIQNNQELLQFTANNYTDLSIYGDIYAAMLANKNNISTITEFVDAFNVGLTLKDLNQASSDEFMNIVREKFDSVKLDEYDTLDAEIQKAVCTRMAAENITDVNQIQTMIAVSYTHLTLPTTSRV